jgi:hypothetical protein
MNRLWKQYDFEKSFVIDSSRVTKPMMMRVDTSGNVYVLDWDDFRIKVFSPDGDLLRTFGEGKSVDRGEFRNPTAFCIGLNGDLWVCDPLLRKIVRFDAQGKLIQTLQPKSTVDRICISGDRLIAMVPPGGERLFEIYSLSGELLKSFGEIIADQASQGIALDGGVVNDGSGHGFIYGGRNIGFLANYSVDGEKQFIVQTIDDLVPTITITDGKKQKVKPNSPTAVLSMSLVGDKLYALSGASDATAGVTSGQIIDVYDKRDGTYLFSFKLPINCREAAMCSDRMYTLGRDGVTMWSFTAKA